MEATIKDKDGYICKAVNSIGIQVNPKALEMILNIAELVKEKQGETSIKDISEVENQVNKLFKEEEEDLAKTHWSDGLFGSKRKESSK